MTGGPRIEHYDWRGGREAILRFGPTTGPVIVAALPLFEEANRTRTFLVTILRALAERGIASALPDLPGTGDSVVETRHMTILGLREAFEAAVEHCWGQGRVHALGIRSGALLDTLALVSGRWHLAPIDGQTLLRELTRIGLSPDTGDPVEIAGNLIARNFLAELASVAPFTADDGVALRTVRLDADPHPSDRTVAAAPLWRRSEPANDIVLAQQLADDIADWIAICER